MMPKVRFKDLFMELTRMEGRLLAEGNELRADAIHRIALAMVIDELSPETISQNLDLSGTTEKAPLD